MANLEFNLGDGSAWAYPRGVDNRFQDLACLMGNVTLAEFVELVQTIETVLPSGESKTAFRQRVENLKILPPKIIRRILLHPVWIYWTRSTRQIAQAKILNKKIPQQWCRHLNPDENTHMGYLQESVDLFSQLLLAACILAGKEIELPIKIRENGFLCPAGSGLAIDCAALFSSDRLPQLNSIVVKEKERNDFVLSFRSSSEVLGSVFYRLKTQSNNLPIVSSVLRRHRLDYLELENHFCEIDNRDNRIIENWVWFDVYPGKPAVVAAEEGQIQIWKRDLKKAFQTLQGCCPLIAAELAYIWRSVIPVNVNQSEQSVSCSSRDFWGAIQVSPHPGIALSEVLAHEYRHNILNALLEFDSIISEECSFESRFYSPWRSDSRPLLGLLHGIYSFVEVVAFNLNYLEKTNGLGRPAKFAEERVITNICRLKIALNELESHAKFTSFGQDFFEGMVRRVREFEANTVNLTPSFKCAQTQNIEKQYFEWLKKPRA